MKTEHRQFLETNWLAARLAKWIEKIKPHTGLLVGGLVVFCGIVVVSSFWTTQSAAKHQAAWDEFAIARNTTDPEMMSLRRVADKEEYSGTPMREWAYVTWADRQVLLASSEYLINRESAQDRLRIVIGIYEELAEGVADAVIQNRARFGLARVFELQNKLEEAREQYSLVQGDLEPMATYRAEKLESPKVQEACAWLASAELPRRSFDGGAGESSSRPNFDASLPDVSLSDSSQDSTVSDPRTLEEILGIEGEEASSEQRYTTDEDTEGKTDETDAIPQDSEKPAAESNSSESVDSEATETAEDLEPEADADAAE